MLSVDAGSLRRFSEIGFNCQIKPNNSDNNIYNNQRQNVSFIEIHSFVLENLLQLVPG